VKGKIMATDLHVVPEAEALRSACGLVEGALAALDGALAKSALDDALRQALPRLTVAMTWLAASLAASLFRQEAPPAADLVRCRELVALVDAMLQRISR
jgi:hypothetical protein